MSEIPVSGASAVYSGKRYSILRGGKDWVAIRTEPREEVSDAVERGESTLAPGHCEARTKIPITALNRVFDVDVTALIARRQVSLGNRWAGGCIRIRFVDLPTAARDLAAHLAGESDSR